MNVLDLPDVFLREVVKTMSIKDRIRMGRTCRGFKRIVEDANAGHFSYGYIKCMKNITDENMTVTLFVGTDQFHFRDLTEQGVAQFLTQWKRHCRGISFEEFEWVVEGKNSRKEQEVIKELMRTAKIRRLHFNTSSEYELRNALRIMFMFPKCGFSMDLWFLPDPELMQFLPRMEKIKISPTGQIPTQLLFELLDAHKDLNLRNVQLTADEWTRMLQLLSDDTRKRNVQLGVRCSTVVECLRQYGILSQAMASEAGGVFGEFEVTKTGAFNRHYFSYRKCTIETVALEWPGQGWNADIYMSNCVS